MALSDRFSVRALSLALAAATSGMAINASASMGNLATTYGILPTDVGSAQALSMFNTQVSATYYNPAYLAKDSRGELTGGLLHAEPEIRAEASDRNGDILSNKPSQHAIIGMKTNLSSLTRLDHPLYLGFIAGVEKYGKEMLAFESTTGVEGQHLEYGRQPLFLNVGGATTLWRGIDVGASFRVTLHSSASMVVTTDLAGNTQYETLQVNAKPSIRSILSTNLDFGETFCPDSSCWLDGFEAAFAYRSSSNTRTTVDATTIIPGLIPASAPLILAVSTYDSYQPSIYSVGAQYSGDNWRVGVTLEQQNWSDLESQFEGDTIKDQANAQFDDILIPRIGAEFKFAEHFGVTVGMAYQEAALKSDSTLDVNYFDHDKYIVGLGLSAEYARTRLLTYPVRLDLGYQRQMLQERDFTLTNTRPDGQQSNNIVATTDGDVDVLTGSITLKF
ncbi:aromatic hydrocarbon degradation protein [Marinobacter zhejiangensis]|uniref:Long-chain fatty acid transport protein n=1 Tax=Marinobacter zhejiangensis TaxID=488535 RepID=A0A1I4MHK9_9GAMM|nr:aromatic hydrocarbon degradation protein [Marinobacter zhejiangensis]SFM02497.1 Long-chain fatty acid transport protein [Marinobacter zhejiangensis]